MLTPERLKAIKERCERATEGPWIVSPNRHKAKDGSQWGIIEARIRTVTGGIVAHTICTWDGDNGRANAEFIRAAREDVPALVAEVERLRDFRFLMRQIAGSWRQYAETAVNYATNEQEAAAAKVRAQTLVECAEAIELALRDMEGGQGDQ